MKQFKKWESSSIGILTNQTGYGWNGDYHFRILEKFIKLKRIFIPEHGLFGELQDQVSGSCLKYFSDEVEFWNLYGDKEDSLVPPENKLLDLDAVFIDIRDVGARYYTFLTTAFYIMQKLSQLKSEGNSVPSIVVLDSPNPIGKKIEGTPLVTGYDSFVGVTGVVHRHGLTPGELLEYYNIEYNLSLDYHCIPVGKIHPKEYDHYSWIPPSPNIPSLTSCLVYPGQCLLEGTNLSEGRGTTRPFEIFGAPYINYEDSALVKELESIGRGSFYLRPLRFVPTFHKFKSEICGGFQLHIREPKKFHSLLFTLHLIRIMQRVYPKDFAFLDGVYEFRSDRPAIELLVGDPILLNYIHGIGNNHHIFDYLQETETSWKKKISSLS
jgi:uncharacterized protein YbbC (DUF1343 family)